MNATQELDTASRLAREVEEIAKIEAALDANPDAQRSLADLRVRLIDLQPTVRVSVAADLLGISLPTIRAWMEDGPLREAGGSSPRRVSLASVLEIRPFCVTCARSVETATCSPRLPTVSKTSAISPTQTYSVRSRRCDVAN